MGNFVASMRHPLITVGSSVGRGVENARTDRGLKSMLSRFPAAFARALFVALLITFPSVALPVSSGDSRLAVVFLAMCAGAFTLMEYLARAPSLLEFRDAPPFNRIRFTALLISVMLVSYMLRVDYWPSPTANAADRFGAALVQILDVPFSPVRLMRQVTVDVGIPGLDIAMAKAAAISFFFAMIAVGGFLIVALLGAWPSSSHQFNLWINLPTFDPVGRGDAVARLIHMGRVNLLIGFLLPFLLPVIITALAGVFNLGYLAAPHALIWTVTAWAFVPASLMMRGTALLRVARMVQDQRRQTVMENTDSDAPLSLAA